MGHVIGWDCVDRMNQEAGLERRMNTTGMRHFTATGYALLDVAPRHIGSMGHSVAFKEKNFSAPQL